MVRDPNLILYACIATGTTVLAEFNSNDHTDLCSLALKCLTNTPPLHSIFTHTIRGKTYAFLIQNPFTYFSIFDEKLEPSEGIVFLKSIKQAFGNVANDDSVKGRLGSLESHCFQGEFHPVFHHLLAGGLEELPSPSIDVKLGHQSSGSLDSCRGQLPLLSADLGNGLKKKKKKSFFSELARGGMGGRDGERKVDVCDDSSGSRSLSKEFSVVLHKNNSLNNGLIGSVEPALYQKHVKKAWKKHVWIVLSLDLIVCIILFVVWLCVCRGFKCIDG